MSDTLELEPLASSVRSARLFVVDRLQEWRCDDLVDRVALLTSELATNAVVHTGQPYSVTVERRGPCVRVEVTDRTDELPHVRDDVNLDDVLADGGDPLMASEGDDHRWFSGLGIVERTASAWGSEAVPGAGKIVWFEVMGADAGEGGSRSVMSELSDLRSPAPDAGSGSTDGREAAGPSPRPTAGHTRAGQEQPVDDDERVVEERRYVDGPRHSGFVRLVVILLIIAALAVAAFFTFG